MAPQQFYQPGKRSSRDDGMYNDESSPLGLPDYKPKAPGVSKEETKGVLGDIDSALAENDVARKSFTGDQLATGEKTADEGTETLGGTAAAKESDLLGDSVADQVGKGYSGDTSGGGKTKVRGRFSRRQKTIGGGIIGLLVGGGIGVFSILQGPLQLVHLSQILGKGMLPSVNSSNKRIPHLYKYMGIRNAAEAKLSLVGRQVYRSTVSRLAARGIHVTSTATGFAKYTVDIPKAYPQFAELTGTNQRLALAREIGIDPAKIQHTGGVGSNTGFLEIDGSQLNTSEYRAVTRLASDIPDAGKVSTAVRGRLFKQAHKVPTIFHPFRRLENAVDRRLETSLRAWKQKQAETTAESRKSIIPEKARVAKAKVQEFANTKAGKLVNGGTIVIDIACGVYHIADAIPLVNWGYVVVPSMVEALETTGGGNQAMKGQDVNLSQVGAKLSSFTDENGRSIWESKPLNALANNSGGQGEDLDNGLRQAFSPRTTEDMLKDYLGGVIGGAVSTAGDVICSEPFLLLNSAVGLTLTVGSGGTWTAGKVISAGSQAVIMSAILGHLANTAVDHFTEDPVKAFSGPVGGSLLAYGARAANNSLARMGGGVELDSSEERMVWEEINREETEEFGQKSFFARMFDVSDYRSLASTVAVSVDLEPGNAFSSIITSLSNIPKLVSNLFSGLTPKLQAQEEPYDWGFPLYGMPNAILDSPRYEDPFGNANQVTPLFEKGQYIDKARKCFGVNITKGSNGWDAVFVENVNPAEGSYSGAGCDNLSDESWKRVMLFVYDTQLMSSLACYEGVDESQCSQLGF